MELITPSDYVEDLSVAVDKFMAMLAAERALESVVGVETRWSKLFIEVQKLKSEFVLKRANGVLPEKAAKEFDALQKRVHDLDYAIRLLSDSESSLVRELARFANV